MISWTGYSVIFIANDNIEVEVINLYFRFTFFLTVFLSGSWANWQLSNSELFGT